MGVRAAVFDIGGVLERVGPPAFLDGWRDRLGMDPGAFGAALARVDPEGLVVVGGVDEAELVRRWSDALGLGPAQAPAFVADVWDWYCGELDTVLVAFVASLRPDVRTGILSNSADGARREEQRRWGFEQLVDDVVYSHEVGLAKPDPAVYALACRRLGVAPADAVFVDDVAENVEAARRLGMHAVLHEDTAATIAAVREAVGTAGT